jgi:hypothetical protein
VAPGAPSLLPAAPCTLAVESRAIPEGKPVFLQHGTPGAPPSGAPLPRRWPSPDHPAVGAERLGDVGGPGGGNDDQPHVVTPPADLAVDVFAGDGGAFLAAQLTLELPRTSPQARHPARRGTMSRAEYNTSPPSLMIPEYQTLPAAILR